MLKRKCLSDEQIRNAIDASDDENIVGDEYQSEDSDSEVDCEENASELEDEQYNSDNEDDNGNQDELTASDVIFIGKDGTEWKSSPYNERKVRAINIIRGGVHKVKLPPGKCIDSPGDAFELFFDLSALNIIVKNTNVQAVKIVGDLWKPTDTVEIRAFIGLLINAGINKQGIIDYKEFWDPLFGNPIFRACLSKNRFIALLRHLRFDDRSTRSSRRMRDKFAPIRELWELINKNLLKHYLPGENLTIDEQLVPFRGRTSFRQYIPSKPDKYGMKIWWICDSSTSYPLFGLPYLGKEGPNKTQNLAEIVVKKLCTPFTGTNRNITFDNYFTSFQLAQTLLSTGLTCVGTLRKNKRCIPPNFLPNKNREIKTNIFGFRNKMTLVSYVPKKNRAVILLSTMHYSDMIDKENRNKSEINLYYNSTKGGVDTLDQLVHAYSTKRKTNRWPMAQFYNLIDICGVAAMVAWLKLYPDWMKPKFNIRRKLFLKELVLDMVIPNIQRRSLQNLSKSSISIIKEILEETSGNVEIEDAPRTSISTRRRCYMCPTKKGRASKQCCGVCGFNICNEHSQKSVICKQCTNK